MPRAAPCAARRSGLAFLPRALRPRARSQTSVKGSFKIGNVFGIPVRIHATFLLLVYALYLFSDGALKTLGGIGLVFGCVLLHELGHSLVARGFGLKVADITLWPLGGMARMSEIPENSRIEALIAIAGPAVNFALAGLALVAIVTGAAFGLEAEATSRLLLFLLAVNVLQGGFNLVPAFPMDGGRLLRAFLGRKRDWVSATEAAVRVGRYVALCFFLGSIVIMIRAPQQICMLPLVALFVWFEGTRELWSVRLRHGLSPLGGGARFAWSAPAPAAPADAPPPAHEDSGEPGSARRPQSWTQRHASGGGFSEDEIRRIEAHRGPLRRPPEEP